MLRRIGVLASLAVVATMFAGISSAQAAVGDAGVCVFTGLAGNLNGTSPPTGAAGIPSALDDLFPGGVPDLDDDREHGTYRYGFAPGGTANCAGTFGGAVVAPNDSVTITSEGEYENIVCGSGWAHDLNGDGTTITANTTTSGPEPVSVTDVGYEIPFVAGNGPLIIGGDLPSTAGSTFGQPIGGDYVGTGAVHIHPAGAPNDCVNGAGVSAFTVAGAFVAAGFR